MELGLIIAFLVVMWVSLRHDVKSFKSTKNGGGTKKVKQEDTEEYVYVIANPSFDTGIFKIGLTTQLPEKRMKQLFTTGVPTPFQFCFLIKTDDCKALEKQMHQHFAHCRVSANREFFRFTEKEIMQLKDFFVKPTDYTSQFAIDTALGYSLELENPLGLTPGENCIGPSGLSGGSQSVPFEVKGTIA